MLAKHDEQVKLICILTFHKRYITLPFEKFRPETWPGKPVDKATPNWQLTSSPKMIYVAYIPIKFAKHDEQVKLICKLTFNIRYRLY